MNSLILEVLKIILKDIKDLIKSKDKKEIKFKLKSKRKKIYKNFGSFNNRLYNIRSNV